MGSKKIESGSVYTTCVNFFIAFCIYCDLGVKMYAPPSAQEMTYYEHDQKHPEEKSCLYACLFTMCCWFCCYKICCCCPWEIYSVVAALERVENDAVIFPYSKFMSQRKKKQQNIKIWTPKDQNNFVMDFLSYDPLIWSEVFVVITTLCFSHSISLSTLCNPAAI